jgi:hypothetical protein
VQAPGSQTLISGGAAPDAKQCQEQTDSGYATRTNRTQGDIMKNVDMSVEGNILIIKVDLSKEYGPSSSGKTIIISSTEGNVSVPDREEVKVGLNVFKKK